MVAHQIGCDVGQLKLLLDDRLPDGAAEHIRQHLESCDTCRHTLETLAAPDTWWQEASRYLGPDDASGERSGASEHESAAHDQRTTHPVTEDPVLEFLSPCDDPALLGRLGKYGILEVIGRGGMGVVLKGHDSELNRYVAIKVLAPHYAAHAAARRRFIREAQAAAAVVHPHVVAIHAVDASGKLPYLVMPYVACESLQERIERDGPLRVTDVLRIGMQAAQGLAAAHAQGLVHRDVKPANILLEQGVERVLLTDFGLARAIDDASLTSSGIIAGTPPYMSPEQATGETLDHRTDLFSLGSVLYAACTGRPPFRAESALGVLRRICDTQPRPVRDVNPDVPPWVASVIHRLLAKRREDRYQTAHEVAELLERCLAHVQHPTAVALPASLRLASAVAVWRRWRWSALLAVGLSVLAGVLLIALPRMFLADRDPVGQPRNEPEAATTDSQDQADAASGTPVPKPATTVEEVPWQDGVEARLRTIGLDLQRLEDDLDFRDSIEK
jgi:serine/threonine-protein kinase